MMKIIQEELFGLEDYTFLCRNCRSGFPRSIEFFPEGRCRDKLSSICRKCSNYSSKSKPLLMKMEDKKSHLLPTEKTCEECGDIKNLREFYMSSHSFDGKTRACKNCIDEIHSERQTLQECFSDFAWVVYFIQDSRNKKVKIGTSGDPEKTLSELQEGSSEKLFLLALHDSGEKDKAENAAKTLYSLFQTHHNGNGWFEMVPSLEQYISQLNSVNREGAIRLLYSSETNKKKLYKD